MTTRVVNEVTMEPVFDIVTTTRYWMEWHPATIGVDGAVDRPIVLGDVIRERARIGQRVCEGNWQVTERVRGLVAETFRRPSRPVSF